MAQGIDRNGIVSLEAGESSDMVDKALRDLELLVFNALHFLVKNNEVYILKTKSLKKYRRRQILSKENVGFLWCAKACP